MNPDMFMRLLIVLLKIILFVILVAIGAMFALENNVNLSVNLLLLKGPNLTSGVWLTIFLLAGTILGILASSVSHLFRRKKTATKKRKETQISE